jgi:hypothetical protein
MAKILDPENYIDEDLVCEKCGWTGKASESNLIDFYGVSDVKELHCPNCDNVVATLQTPK